MLLPRKSPRISAVALVWAALLVATSGCGGGGATTAGEARPQPVERSSPKQHRAKPVARVVPSHCPADLPSCRTTEGRIIYVERVDPDGDGDAHFVVIDSKGTTLPGLTAIDVRKGLRPHPLPVIGDLISAAGPVQTGSYGQHQIHALELHVAGG
ncbi:MAG TPA: hypothetical protein VIY71_08950 [Solirubrobacterales bacterium]